jgi:hypothetical protein
MKRATLTACCIALACTAPALAANFTVRVVDEDGKPVPGAIVFGREFVNVPQLHGSSTHCARADAAAATAAVHDVELPMAGLGKLAPQLRAVHVAVHRHDGTELAEVGQHRRQGA